MAKLGRRKDKRSGDLEFKQKKLIELIDKLDLIDGDFAILTEYSLSTISRLRRGTKDLTNNNIVQIILNLSPKSIAQKIEKIKSDIIVNEKKKLDNKIFLGIIEKLRPDKTIVQIIEELKLDKNYFEKPPSEEELPSISPSQQQKYFEEDRNPATPANLFNPSANAHENKSIDLTTSNHSKNLTSISLVNKPERS